MSFKRALATAMLIAAAPAVFAQDTATTGEVAEGEQVAAPASAESAVVAATGDAVKGEKVFKKCVACHVVVDAAGEKLAGRAGKTGPNLYGIAGGAFGQAEDFKYGKGAMAAAGTVMDEAAFVAYVADPSGWLKETTGDSSARSKMSFRLKKEDDAKNVFAYLQSLQTQ